MVYFLGYLFVFGLCAIPGYYEIETKNIFDAIVISGLINNIFNTEYVDRGYYYTYDDTWSNPGAITTVDGAGYYPQATANFLVGVTLKF